MIKRRIKRNFEEQLAVVSSLTVTSPKSTNDKTKSKKNRNWSYNKVWRRVEPQKQENGRDPGGRVTAVPPLQTKVTHELHSQTKVKRGPPQTVRGWRYNRVWRRDRVWRRENLSVSSAMTPVTQSPFVTSVTNPPVVTSGTQPPAVVTSVTQSSVFTSVTQPLVVASVTQPPAVVTSVTKSSAPTTNTVPSSEVRVSDTAKTNSASLTIVKTTTSCTHEPATVSTTYDVPCTETQSYPISTEKTQGKARPNRCSSREDEVRSPADTRGVSSKDIASDPPVAGDKKHLKESLKRKHCEPQNTMSKRILLEHSAADSQLTSVSYRFLWSMETLFDELCLVFEDFRL